MVLSFVTFFNGRVEKQRQAQRDSGLLFFYFFLFYCCGLAFVSFEHVRFVFTFVGPIFVLRGPKLYAPRSAYVAYRAQIKYPVYHNPISICLDFMNLAMDLDLRNTKSKFFV